MPRTSSTLHGNAPDESEVAILVVDVINDLMFEGGEDLLPHAEAMARALSPILRAARERHVPVVYVNDNQGRWRCDLREILAHALRKSSRGRALVRALRPHKHDYVVLKPEGGGFHQTTLDTLLHHLGVERLVVTGLVTDRCVLFTAYEAYVRGYRVHVPSNCVAAVRPDQGIDALAYMERVLEAETSPLAASRLRKR